MSFCHAIEVLDGVDDTRLVRGVSAWLHVEDKAALEDEIVEFGVVFAGEGSRSFGIAFFWLRGVRRSVVRSWGLLYGMEGREQAQDEGLIIGPQHRIETCGSGREYRRLCGLQEGRWRWRARRRCIAHWRKW